VRHAPGGKTHGAQAALMALHGGKPRPK